MKKLTISAKVYEFSQMIDLYRSRVVVWNHQIMGWEKESCNHTSILAIKPSRSILTCKIYVVILRLCYDPTP
jgi:hypothetical protein